MSWYHFLIHRPHVGEEIRRMRIHSLLEIVLVYKREFYILTTSLAPLILNYEFFFVGLPEIWR